MKNKDGITIEVDQVWCGRDGYERRVVGFTSNNLVVSEKLNNNTVYAGEGSNWRFANLVSDPSKPWLPLPSGYRLVTEEEGGYRVPEDHMVLDVKHGTKDPIDGCDWREGDGSFHRSKRVIANLYGTLIAIPIDHVWEEDKPKIEYEVFEIDWRRGAPFLEDLTLARIGRSTDCGFTLFGYTDDPDWAEKVNHDHPEGEVPHYYTKVCDHKGNRKYAIGRKEMK